MGSLTMEEPLVKPQLGESNFFESDSQLQQIPFDKTPVTDAPMSVLEKSLWQRFVSDVSSDSEQTQLIKLALTAYNKDGELHPTVAGLLIASRQPHEFLNGSVVQATACRGTEDFPLDDLVRYQLDAVEITGAIDQQIMKACAFVRRNMRIAAVKFPTGGRKDIPQFDMPAVFEAVVNAVAHRDYSMIGAKVRVRVFDDRIEICSPGTLPKTMTLERLECQHFSRNDALTNLLAHCPTNRSEFTTRTYIMGKRGEGIPLILDNCEKLSGRRPVYEMLNNSELRVTIYGFPGAIPQTRLS